MDKRVVIVMTYFNRREQLRRTLLSLNRYTREKFFVVIVDDGSDEEIEYPKINFKDRILVSRFPKHKEWRDSRNPRNPWRKGYALKGLS